MSYEIANRLPSRARPGAVDIGALVTVVSSTDEPVSLIEAKLWCKVEEDEVTDDVVFIALIATAVARYEAFTGRALMRQTYDWYLDRTPDLWDCPLRPPRWPLISVSSIRGFGTTDASDTGGTAMSTSGYYVDVAHEPGRIQPVSGAIWPVATRDLNALIVRFDAGYSTTPSSGIPEQAKERLKKMIAAAYEHRGDEVAMNVAMNEVLGDDDLDLPEWGGDGVRQSTHAGWQAAGTRRDLRATDGR